MITRKNISFALFALLALGAANYSYTSAEADASSKGAPRERRLSQSHTHADHKHEPEKAAAEAAKTKADAEKLEAEAAKTKADAEKLEAEAAKTKVDAEKLEAVAAKAKEDAAKAAAEAAANTNNTGNNKKDEPSFFENVKNGFCKMNHLTATAPFAAATWATTIAAQSNINPENPTASKAFDSLCANLRGASLTAFINALTRGYIVDKDTTGWPVFLAHLIAGMAADAAIAAVSSDDEDDTVADDEDAEPNYVGIVATWAAKCLAANLAVAGYQKFTAPAPVVVATPPAPASASTK